MTRTRWGRGARAVLACALGIGLVGIGGLARATDAADEIHYSYGSTPDSVVFDWRGGDTTLYYGTDLSSPLTATASLPAVTPVDDPVGPFREVAVAGLAPGTTYSYRIGLDGDVHTFTTTPTGTFTWVDMGDTGTSLCEPWMPAIHSLVAAQSPSFVTHGGDISYANECGVPAVHQYFADQQAWSEGAAFMPAWGNHEYGPPSGAPAGTPRDTLANYKGRVAIPNPQTVPADTASKTSNPGCGAEIKSSTNTCRGEDWGSFTAGGVLYISYPEPSPGAYPSWEAAAQNLMATAQADPAIDFIVTYGHRPAYSSLSASVDTNLRAALTTLSGMYSPTQSHPDGKYVLNVNHHIHGEEVFAPIGGLVNITNGGGGAGQVSYGKAATGSIFRASHPSILAGTYDATAHTLKVSLVCGPVYTPSPKSPCVSGDSMYEQTFSRTPAPPPTPTLTTAIDDGTTSPTVGQPVTYTVTATNPAAGTTASGVTASATLPGGYSITDAGSGSANGSTVTWPPDDIAGGASAVHTVTATLTTGNPGDSLMATAQLQEAAGVCAAQGSNCSASDTDTVAGARQWVTNQDVETDLTGWTGVWNSASRVTRATTDGYSGTASIQVARGSGTGAAGVNSKPRPVTSTVAANPYTASVWVKGNAAGETISLQLKETTPGGAAVGTKTVWIKVPDSAWHQLTLTLAAARGGDQLTFSVYCANLPAAGWFRADLMSLTSPS